MTSADGMDAPAPPSLLPKLPSIIWQRRWLLILPLVLTSAAGVAIAVLMPPMYESAGTVLIESPQLPTDLVSSPVTDIVDQRIARTRERVLSRTDLIRLIRANNLYPREQRTMALSKIVDRMRDDTVLEAVNADLQTSRGVSNGSPNTIAITIGFRYPDPAKAQLIAQQYVNHFLELDAATQSEQALGAAGFLNDQANEIQTQIAAIERRVNEIKSKNGAVFALSAIGATGDVTSDAARLNAEIAGLQAQNSQLAKTPEPGNAAVTAAELALRAAQARYSDSHPDVEAAKAQLAAAQRAASTSAYNPAKGQLAANQQQILALQSARAMLLSQSSASRSAQSRAPVLSAQVDQMEKQADALRDQYRNIGNKLQSAQVSARMQTQQKGERLVLADPPITPDHPYKPNRPIIIAGAVAIGGGIGLALILLIELMLRPLRGTEAVTYAVGEAPLVVIPDFRYRPNPIIRFIEARRRKRAAA